MGKLREIKNVPQNEPGLRKQWFTDDEYWDIYVWTNKANEIVGIQICYERSYGEKALTWLKGKVFDHSCVNPDYLFSNRSGTPVLMPDGKFDNMVILKRFLKDSVDMDRRVVYFIKKKINEFTNSVSEKLHCLE
ncbi:MAG: hypothetical protein JXB88_12160 [Spirochaetales bacterium]|nr:hypothetical protein [Spirochaetales bacterium]